MKIYFGIVKKYIGLDDFKIMICFTLETTERQRITFLMISVGDRLSIAGRRSYEIVRSDR